MTPATPFPSGTPTLAVVMPAYNEEGAVEDAVADVRTHILDKIAGSSLLVVNDGSRDQTGTILDRLAAADPRVSALHKPNGGHGPAIISGLSATSSDFVFLIDSDRQITLDHFADAWRLAVEGSDGVFGVRKHRDDPALRLVLTAVIRWSNRLLFGVRIFDANVPYKLIRRSVWERARTIIPPDTLAPSLFLAIFMKRAGMDVAELEITHRERQTGEVSIKRWKLLKFCARAFRQLLAFRAGLQRA